MWRRDVKDRLSVVSLMDLMGSPNSGVSVEYAGRHNIHLSPLPNGDGLHRAVAYGRVAAVGLASIGGAVYAKAVARADARTPCVIEGYMRSTLRRLHVCRQPRMHRACYKLALLVLFWGS